MASPKGNFSLISYSSTRLILLGKGRGEGEDMRQSGHILGLMHNVLFRWWWPRNIMLFSWRDPFFRFVGPEENTFPVIRLLLADWALGDGGGPAGLLPDVEVCTTREGTVPQSSRISVLQRSYTYPIVNIFSLSSTNSYFLAP